MRKVMGKRRESKGYVMGKAMGKLSESYDESDGTILGRSEGKSWAALT